MDAVILSELENLYADIGRLTDRLEWIHSKRLACKLGCASCCVDNITVWEIEAAFIRHHDQELLRRGRPGGRGSCAFLDEEGACRIYPHRPYVCRTQGYPLRWLDGSGGNEHTELRDICPLNETDEPIEELPKAACWTIGPFEERLAHLQATASAGAMNRIFLRKLFK